MNILTDSRNLTDPKETTFFAIVTPTGDGHRYIPELYAKGVRDFVVARGYAARHPELAEGRFREVDDTLAALQKEGASHRADAREVVAITGSRGKTTLKEWLFQLLSPLKKIVRSPRSYNSQLGVALSLHEIRPDTELAIIEAGVSREGEMETLRDMIRPDTVIVTNLGAEHEEGFRDMAAKAREKMSLARGARRVIYPADDPLLSEAADELKRLSPETELIGWTTKDPEGRYYVRRNDDGTMDYVFNRTGNDRTGNDRTGRDKTESDKTKGDKTVSGRLTVPSATRADFENSVATFLYMMSQGIPEGEIVRRFEKFEPAGTRLQVVEGMNGCSIIEDSYTSDYSSLGPVLDFMKRRSTGGQGLTVILSDPDREGTDRDAEYREMARLLESKGVSRVIGIGEGIGRHRELFGFAADARFHPDTASFLATVTAADFIDEMILLKGAPRFGFGEIARILEARTHETVLEVNLDAVVENYNTFRSRLPRGTGLICMVKADAYGAGSAEMASVLQDCGAAYLAVAVIDEGIALRKRGITMPVMVMNPRVSSYATMFNYDLEPEIYSFSMLEDVIREAEKRDRTAYPIHIKLDTGMHRTGFQEGELPALMDRLESQSAVKLRTVFSHLATADCPDMDSYTLGQIERFEAMTAYMARRRRESGSEGFLRHILNSAGILRFPQYHYDFARLGIGLYGARILPPELQPEPAVVSTLRTVVINVRSYEAGEAVGYGRKGLITGPTKVATIPIGYADGMNRRFGNGAVKVRVNGHECPTIGNICMDACMIDVTGVEVKEGDPVEIFGRAMPVEALSDAIGTIPYEILTSISPRVKRVYSRG